MPSTKYKPGEIPSKASTMANDELRTAYAQRKRYRETPISSTESIYEMIDQKKDAILADRKSARVVQTQKELFALLEQDQSIGPDPSEFEEIDRLVMQAHQRQGTADENKEPSLMNDQLDLRDGVPLGDATHMSILRFVSRSATHNDPRDLCLTKAQEYCTPSVPGTQLFDKNTLDPVRQAEIRKHPWAEDGCYPENPTDASQPSESGQKTEGKRCGCMTPVPKPVSLLERISTKATAQFSRVTRGAHSSMPTSTGTREGAREEGRRVLRQESSMISEDS